MSCYYVEVLLPIAEEIAFPKQKWLQKSSRADYWNVFWTNFFQLSIQISALIKPLYFTMSSCIA